MTRSVLDITDVLVTIVQYTTSAKDVSSFLRALPPSILTPPLAALLELITPDKPWLSTPFWPQPRTSAVHEDNIDRFVTAMPVFSSVYVDSYSFSKRWPTYDFTDWGSVDDPPFFRFVVYWAAKVTHLNLMSYFHVAGRRHEKAFIGILRCCTSLQVAQVPYATAVLAALTTPAHCVQYLDLAQDMLTQAHPIDATTHVERWLTSGHSRHRGVVDFDTIDDRIAATLALASSTLSSVCLSYSPAAVEILVTNAVAWTHLTELDLDLEDRPNAFRRLVPLLNLPQLQKLTLRNVEAADGAYLVSILPHFVALTDLDLYNVDVARARTVPLGPSMLCRASFRDVNFTKTSFPAVLDWALRSPMLADITVSGSKYLKKHRWVVYDAMRRCLAAGVRQVAFRNITGLSAPFVSGLPHALCGIHAVRPCRLFLEVHMSEDAASLLAALATCTNVTLDMYNCYGHALLPRDQSLPTGVTIQSFGSLGYGQHITLTSPHVVQV